MTIVLIIDSLVWSYQWLYWCRMILGQDTIELQLFWWWNKKVVYYYYDMYVSITNESAIIYPKNLMNNATLLTSFIAIIE